MHGAGGGAASGPEHPNYWHGVRIKAMSEVRALKRELSESTVWGGHIIFGQGIAGPHQLENFLYGQLKGKKF
jgi:hypothetical protein